jgi:hypothetical protein
LIARGTEKFFPKNNATQAEKKIAVDFVKLVYGLTIDILNHGTTPSDFDLTLRQKNNLYMASPLPQRTHANCNNGNNGKRKIVSLANAIVVVVTNEQSDVDKQIKILQKEKHGADRDRPGGVEKAREANRKSYQNRT